MEPNINNFALEFYRKLSEFGPQHRLLEQISSFNLSRPIRILDIGSGGAMYWHEVLKKFPGTIALDLLDPAAPESLSTLMAEGEVRHIPAIAPQGLSKIPADSYDIVVAFDLIEHMTKSEGYLFLYEVDRITSGTSIIFTPYGFVWQPPSENNPFNAHISGWTPNELHLLGYREVRGHTGFRYLIGAYGAAKWQGLAGRLSHATAYLVRYLPELAFAFSAIKRHEPWRANRHEGVAQG